MDGYAEIGAFLKMTQKQAKHRALAGEIPTFAIGRRRYSRKSTLLAWMAEREAASLTARKSRAEVPTGTPAGSALDLLEVQLDRLEAVIATLARRLDKLEKEVRHGQRS